MTKNQTWFVIIAVVVVTLVAIFVPIGRADAATNTGQVCTGLDSGKIDVSGSHKTVTVTAPAGYLIDEYCVKAGSAKQDFGPEYFPVSPPQQTVTFPHSSGKDISHYSVSYTPVKTTPTPPPPTPQPPVDVCPNMPGDQPKGTKCDTPPTPTPPVPPCEGIAGSEDNTCGPNPPVDVCPNMAGNQPVGTDCTPNTTPPKEIRKPKAAIRSACTGLVGYVLNNTKSTVAVKYKYLNDGKVKSVVVKAGKKKVFTEKAKAHSLAWIKAKGMTTVKTRVPGACSVPHSGQ